MTDKNLNLANSALRLVVAYDDLMRRYTGPVSDLTKADNAAIDEAYDQMVAAARITLDVTSRTTAPAPEQHLRGEPARSWHATGPLAAYVIEWRNKHGKPDGTQYEQGQWDMAQRVIMHLIPPTTTTEGSTDEV